METNDKFISDPNEFRKLLQLIQKFPRLHNTIRDDFLLLLKMTEELKADTEKFETLCRTCIKSLFSLIEADIYYYNLFDAYVGYSDKENFFDKFKKTFKQICTTWNRQELQQNYFTTKLADLKELRSLRDKLIHPKAIEHIIKPTPDTFHKVTKVFNDYDTFISTIMSNFFFRTVIPF